MVAQTAHRIFIYYEMGKRNIDLSRLRNQYLKMLALSGGSDAEIVVYKLWFYFYLRFDFVLVLL